MIVNIFISDYCLLKTVGSRKLIFKLMHKQNIIEKKNEIQLSRSLYDISQKKKTFDEKEE